MMVTIKQTKKQKAINNRSNIKDKSLKNTKNNRKRYKKTQQKNNGNK